MGAALRPSRSAGIRPAGVPVLFRSKRIGEALGAMPTSWLIGLQVYRVFGGIFLVGWVRGVTPGVFALPAGVGDANTGLLALPVAYYLASRNGDAMRSAIAWNIFGLIDFTIAVGIGLAIAPGPLQLIVPSIPNAGAELYPTVLSRARSCSTRCRCASCAAPSKEDRRSLRSALTALLDTVRMPSKPEFRELRI